MRGKRVLNKKDIEVDLASIKSIPVQKLEIGLWERANMNKKTKFG